MTSPIKGALLIVLACAFVAFTTLIAKTLGTGSDAISPIQITWGRYTFALLGLGISWIFLRQKLQTIHFRLHLVRVSFGVSGVAAMFTASTLIPLADATAIAFLNPIVAMIIAFFILRETAGPVRWLMTGFAFVGALLLIRPGSDAFQPAALIALLAAVLLGVEVVAVKLLSGKEPVFQILLMSNLAGTTFTSIAMLWFWQAPTAEQWGMLVLIGLVMLSAQALYVPGLRLGDASFVVPFSYSTLIFAAFYDAIFFGVIPVPLSILGGAIILISGIVLAWREGRAKARKPG